MKKKFNNQTPPAIMVKREDFKKDPQTGLGVDFKDFVETANLVVPSIRDKDGTGYDIFSLLLKERVIVVAGQVETGMATNIKAQLKYLEYQNPGKPITMLINSPGGSVTDGLSILDVMREVKCPIHTVGAGMQASMGSILLAGGDTRRMTKNSALLIHQIMGGASGGTQHSDFGISDKFMAEEHEALKSVYVEFTGLNHAFWDVVGERDSWFSAEQALKLGFITDIVKNEKPGGAFAEYAKREERSRYGKLLEEATQTFLDTTTQDEILKIVNNGSADKGIYSHIRAELLVKLSEYADYQVKGRAQKLANMPAVARPVRPAAANDDVKVSAKRKGPGPQGPR